MIYSLSKFINLIYLILLYIIIYYYILLFIIKVEYKRKGWGKRVEGGSAGQTFGKYFIYIIYAIGRVVDISTPPTLLKELFIFLNIKRIIVLRA